MPRAEKTKSAPEDKAGATQKTLVTLLLDRSNSMERHARPTLSGLNEWLAILRKSQDDIRFSLVLFDSMRNELCLEKVHVCRKIAEIPDLTPADFQPRGSTPLIDAAITTIQAVADSLVGRSDVKVVFAIQTDGEENTSRNSWSTLRELISEKEKIGWEFNFMGAGINAYEQGAQMGLAAEKIMSYSTADDHTRAAFRSMGTNTMAFSSGAAASTAYSAMQKRDAGDAYFQDPDAGPASPAAPSPSVRDLQGYDRACLPKVPTSMGWGGSAVRTPVNIDPALFPRVGNLVMTPAMPDMSLPFPAEPSYKKHAPLAFEMPAQWEG